MNSLSIILPALNESENICQSLEMFIRLMAKLKIDYEILIFDDGSKDDTLSLAKQFASRYSQIKVIHHENPKGLGYCYKSGVRLAKKDHVILLTANNECKESSIEKILSLIGTSDIVIPYVENQGDRPWMRRMFSLAFVRMLNLITGLSLKYYNGTVLHKTSLIRQIPITTDSYAYQAEALIYLISVRRCSFCEVGISVSYKKKHKTKAFKFQNVVSVCTFLFKLFVTYRSPFLLLQNDVKS